MWQMIRQFLNTKQYLYYIGRHDILPPPLKGQQENLWHEQNMPNSKTSA